MVVKTYFHDSSMPIEEYVAFIHDAFRERLDENLNFGCATFSVEKFRKELKNSYTIIVFNDVEEILGSVSLTVVKNKGFIYGWHEYLAVSPNVRGQNIGSTLEREILKIAKQEGLQFMLSSTAFGAYSSIKFHKKSSFKKIAVRTYRLTNYYSYIFIKPVSYTIGTVSLLLMRIPILVVTYIMNHLLYSANGTKRF